MDDHELGFGVSSRTGSRSMPSDDRRNSEREDAQCPSVSLRGKRCSGRRGHGGLHSTEIDGVLYAWSDESSPDLAIDLNGRRND